MNYALDTSDAARYQIRTHKISLLGAMYAAHGHAAALGIYTARLIAAVERQDALPISVIVVT